MAYARWPNADDEKLLQAVRSGNVEDMCAILDRPDTDCSVYQCCMLLTEACSVGGTTQQGGKIDIDVLECLLKRDFSPNTKDTGLHRDTPLHLASIRNDVTAVKLLLQYDADMHAGNRFGQTPLHHACRTGAFEVGTLLLAAGADVNHKDDDACTPLIQAVAADKTDMVQLVLEHGADVDAINDELLTALDHALLYRRRSSISLLLRAGAQFDHKQEGCIYYRGHYCNSILYSLLADNDAENITLLFHCGYTFRDDTVLLFPPPLQRHPSPERRNSNSNDDDDDENTTTTIERTPPPHINLDRNIIEEIKRHTGQPRSLYGACRVVIRNEVNRVRNCLGPSLEARLDSLALPAKVRDYLTLRVQ